MSLLGESLTGDFFPKDIRPTDRATINKINDNSKLYSFNFKSMITPKGGTKGDVKPYKPAYKYPVEVILSISIGSY